MLHKGVYTDSFVLHDETAEDPHEIDEIQNSLATVGKKMSREDRLKRRTSKSLLMPDTRLELKETWQKFFKYQPLWKIRNYFGEKIALYFAWSGTLITSLWIPTIVGLVCFIYGLYQR